MAAAPCATTHVPRAHANNTLCSLALPLRPCTPLAVCWKASRPHAPSKFALVAHLELVELGLLLVLAVLAVRLQKEQAQRQHSGQVASRPLQSEPWASSSAPRPPQWHPHARWQSPWS